MAKAVGAGDVLNALAKDQGQVCPSSVSRLTWSYDQLSMNPAKALRQ